MKRNHWWTFILAGGALLLVLLILTDWLPYLRGPAPETPEWYWPYRLRPFTHWLKPVLASLMMGGIAVWWLWLGRDGRRRQVGLWLLAAVSFLLQLALLNADNGQLRDELINRTYSNLSSGFFQPAAELEGLGSALQHYPALMPEFSSEHARTHPPGLVAANRLTMDWLGRFPNLADWLAPPAIAARCIDLWLLDRPTAVSAALVLWSIIPILAAALTVFPAYWVARLILPETAVKLATLLIMTLPALLLFAPKSVQLYAPLTLLIFGTFQRGLQKWSWRWFFLSGTLFSLATFLSLGNTALGLLLFIYALLYLWHVRKSASLQVADETPPSPHPLALSKSILAFALGAASLWLFYWPGWGVPPWAIAQTALGQHYDLVTNLRRYDWWLVWNMVDVLLFAGWVLVVGFTAVTVQAISKIRRKALTAVNLLALSLAILLIVLNISGSARGEVGRLWLFLLPLLALVAADFLVEVQPLKWQQGLLIGWQLLLLLSLALAWQPVRAVAVVAQRPSRPEITPETREEEVFGEQILLQGYTVKMTDEAIQLTLFWEGLGGVLRPYTVFNQLLDNEGQIVAQKDNWPVNGQWPPTCWAKGEAVVDEYVIPLPSDLPPGTYTLITGWYDARDGRRLLTADNQDQFQIGQFVHSDGAWQWSE